MQYLSIDYFPNLRASCKFQKWPRNEPIPWTEMHIVTLWLQVRSKRWPITKSYQTKIWWIYNWSSHGLRLVHEVQFDLQEVVNSHALTISNCAPVSKLARELAEKFNVSHFASLGGNRQNQQQESHVKWPTLTVDAAWMPARLYCPRSAFLIS